MRDDNGKWLKLGKDGQVVTGKKYVQVEPDDPFSKLKAIQHPTLEAKVGVFDKLKEMSSKKAEPVVTKTQDDPLKKLKEMSKK